eukprot:COSAG02_NODE_359_length_23842_cov_22.550011_20_plen_855_part_00
MLRRAARPRLLLLLAFFGFAGFWYEHTSVRPAAPTPINVPGASTEIVAAGSSFPDASTVAAAKSAATSALATDQQSSKAAVLPLPEESSRTVSTASTQSTGYCTWPVNAQDLNSDAAKSSCRPFIGLLVPCTSAKTCDRNGNCWKTVDDTSLLTELVPSVFRTLAGCECDCKRDECRPNAGSVASQQRPAYDLVIYIGYDGEDAIYDTDTAREQLPQRFKAALQANTQGGFHGAYLPRIGLVLVRCADSRSMVANSNCLSRTAHNDGAEYTYRVNDDTVFETSGWLETLPNALQSLDPPNVGVAGPRATGGNWKILTYDLVHRTHMDVFAGNRYPPSLQNWYSDDWITKVYSGDHSFKGGHSAAQDCMRSRGVSCSDFKQEHMVMLAGTSVKHTRTVDHTRYMPDHNGKDILPQLLDEGSKVLAAFFAQRDVDVKATRAVPKTSSLSDDIKKTELEQSRQAPIVTGKIERRHSETSESSKTAAAIASFGHCPDGKWELRGAQLVCPSAEVTPAAPDDSFVTGEGKTEAEDNEDAIGAADERLSTRFDPNRMQSVCQLPAGRAEGLTVGQYGRLRSDWCKKTASYRRELPSGGKSLSANVEVQDTGTATVSRIDEAHSMVIRARCSTGELRWTDHGRSIQHPPAATLSSHTSSWHTLPRGKELVLPFSSDYVEVVCTLPQQSLRPLAAQASNAATPTVATRDNSEDYAWAAREVFTRFVPTPEHERPSTGGSPDGLNLVVLMVDSLSRAQAMAFLPNFRKLLQETTPLDAGAASTTTGASGNPSLTHNSYVFDHAGTVGAHSGTNSNMGALFAGRNYNFARDDAARVATLFTPWTGMLRGITHFHQLGFVLVTLR